MVFLATGHFTIGRATHDKDGNIVQSVPPKFEFADDGPCVAVGLLNHETMQQIGSAELFGDYDAANYLGRVMEYLSPRRTPNIPDFQSIFNKMTADGINVCEYCDGNHCGNCIVRDWEET